MFLSQTGSGQTLYWDSNGATPGAGTTPTGTWGTSAFWSTDPTGSVATGAWTSGDSVVFSAGTDATGSWTLTVNGAQTVNSFTIEEGNITLSGSAINATSMTIDSGATLQIPSTSSLGVATGGLSLNGGTIQENNPGNGGSFISASTAINVGAAGGTISFNSAAANSSIYSGTIGGTGVLTKTGTGEFRYQGFDTSTTFSKLVVNQGLYRLGNGSHNSEQGFGAVPASFTADAITLTGGGQIGLSFSATLSANRGITLGSSGGGFNMLSAPMTVSGAVSGTGGLTVSGGSQALAMNGVNSFTGGFTMNGGGNVTIGSSGKLSGVGSATITSGTLTLNNPATTITSLSGAGNLAFANGHVLTTGDSTSPSFTGVISGTGSIVKQGSGSQTLGGGSPNTFSGSITINNGSIVAGKANALGNSANGLALGGGTFNTGGLNQTLGTLTLSANSSIDLGSGSSATAFADSSGQSWSGTLDIFNYTAGSDTLRIGTSDSGITVAQLSEVYFPDIGGGEGASIDPNGFLVPTVVPEPSSAIVGLCAGIAAFMASFYRRNRKGL
jgi:fibronectin-binding autotransporter adhesin